MVPLLAQTVWHYWLSIALLAPIGLILVGIAVLYVLRVLSSKPRQ